MPKYGLPEKIMFCKRCLASSAQPISCNEFKHTIDMPHDFIKFDEEGICSACRFFEKRNEAVDWEAREKELLELLDQYRSTDGSYDCLIPGSGGKDSAYASHVLKYKYGMHPLTVTWTPHLYTDIGWKNFHNWIHTGGFDNYLFSPNGKIHRLLTRNAFINLLHPFQPFILGQKTFGPKMAARFNIKLIFYGENQGEYGDKTSLNQKKFSMGTGEGGDQGFRLDYAKPTDPPEEVFLGGKSLAEYFKEGLTYADLASFLPADPQMIAEKNIEFHYLGYYLKWVPQECFYYAQKHTGFEVNPMRTEGTYSKYNSIDDKTDGFFYYTTYIKYGFGRARYDASQEIRNGHITKEEGEALIRRYDGEFPERYFREFLDYISLTEKEFWDVIDSFRDPSIWHKVNGNWELRYSA